MGKNKSIIIIFIGIILLSLNAMACHDSTAIPRLENRNANIINYQDFFMDTVNLGLDLAPM
jgi:hypothetical protein